MQIKQIFVNLPVADLERTKKFWGALGFGFNPQFTGPDSLALVLGENIFAMLLTPQSFARFTKEKTIITDAHSTVEAILAFSVGSREDADAIMKAAVATGGKEHRPVADEAGFMYGGAFEDPDGHIWEAYHMDFSKLPSDGSMPQ